MQIFFCLCLIKTNTALNVKLFLQNIVQVKYFYSMCYERDLKLLFYYCNNYLKKIDNNLLSVIQYLKKEDFKYFYFIWQAEKEINFNSRHHTIAEMTILHLLMPFATDSWTHLTSSHSWCLLLSMLTKLLFSLIYAILIFSVMLFFPLFHFIFFPPFLVIWNTIFLFWIIISN